MTSAIPFKTDLISSVEDLSYAKRWTIYVPLRQSIDTSAELQALVAELGASGDAFERSIASCIISDARVRLPIIIALLLDPVETIARRVIRAAARNVTQEDIFDLFPRLTPGRIHRFSHALIAQQRGDVIDAFFTQHAAEKLSAVQRQRMMPFLSLEKWQSLPNEALWCGTFRAAPTANWRCMRQLTALHPSFVVDSLTREAEAFAKKEFDLPYALNDQINTALVALSSTSDASLGLKFLKSAASKTNVRADVFAAYKRRSPAEVVDILRENKLDRERSMKFTRRMWIRIRKTSPDLAEMLSQNNLIAGVNQRSFDEKIPSWVCKLIYKYNQPSFVNAANGSISPRILQKVGAEIRVKEAERCFALPSLEACHRERIEYLGLLPYPRAVEIGAIFITNADADLRIATAAQIVSSCRYFPEYLTDVLDFGLKRKNEQDPWKAHYYVSLAALPPTRWSKDNLSKLLELIDSAATAKDLSNMTITNIVKLICNVMRSDIDFTLKHLSKWLALLGHCNGLNLKPHLNAKNALTVWNALVEEVTRGVMKNQQWHSVRNFIEQFEKVSVFLGDGPKKLFVACVNSANAQLAKAGLELMLEHYRKETTTTLIPTLLEKEPDWIFVDGVSNALSDDIQGPLLQKYLTSNQETFTGRFEASFRRHAVGPFHFEARNRLRWTSKMQNSYADALLKNLTKEGHSANECRWWFSRLRDLPALQLGENNYLLQCANNPNESEAAKRDYALQTFAYMSDAKSLAILTESLVDARARTALPALKRRLRFVGPDAALSMLRRGIENKGISVQKDLIRTIGAIGTRDAFATLQEWSDRPDLHKDLRIVLLQTYFNFLDNKAVWGKMIESVGPDSRVDVAMAIAQCPDSNLIEDWQKEQFCNLLSTLLKHSHSGVVSTTVSRISSSWTAVEDTRFRAPLLALLEVDNSALNSQAFNALRVISIPPSNIVSAVVALKIDKCLQRFVESLVSSTARAANVRESAKLLALCKDLRTALAKIGRQASLCCDLLMVDAPSAWAPTLAEWETSNVLHCGAMSRVISNVQIDRWSNEEALSAETAMRTHESGFIRRLGFSLLQRIAAKGWTDELRAGLEVYQKDVSSWVRDDALLIIPPAKA